MTFVALGDSGGTDKEHGEIVDAGAELYEDVRGTEGDENQEGKVCQVMLATKPDLCLHTGDVVYPEGARADYPAGFFRPFAALIASVPVYPTLGNHDVKTQGGAPYLETFFTPTNGVEANGRTYSFDWANVHFTCLDVQTTPYERGSPQLAWLEHDLATTDRPWKVVWFHNPPMGASSQGDDAGLQEHVMPVLEKHGVDLCLSGHQHVYARFFPVGNVTYVTTGAGGKNLYAVRDHERLAYAESVFHFVHVEVDGPQLTLRATDATGGVFDTVVIRKS
jgi:acid phosphatase type 7